jgi:hypothetical protein
VGSGGELSISLCNTETNFDTQISVFTGECNYLQCIGGNDEAEAEDCGFTSDFTFQSQPFQKYLVAVHGFMNATGSFRIFLEDLSDPPVFDTCNAAGGPLPLNTASPIFLAKNGSMDDGLFECDVGFDFDAADSRVWLYVEGDGGNITASVCDASLDMKIVVFQGDCMSLACVEGTSGGCSITFVSVENQKYYIFVRSSRAVRKPNLSLSSSGKPPALNDNCNQAIPLQVDSGVVVPGTTIGASMDEIPNGVCGEKIDSPGVWYSVTGTGMGIAVGLCQGTTFDTKISVFENTCDSLLCIGGNDDWCGTQSAYGWLSSNQTTYYILVHGFESVGDFGIIAVTT